MTLNGLSMTSMGPKSLKTLYNNILWESTECCLHKWILYESNNIMSNRDELKIKETGPGNP